MEISIKQAQSLASSSTNNMYQILAHANPKGNFKDAYKYCFILQRTQFQYKNIHWEKATSPQSTAQKRKVEHLHSFILYNIYKKW